jgi:hypothetical protein
MISGVNDEMVRPGLYGVPYQRPIRYLPSDYPSLNEQIP